MEPVKQFFTRTFVEAAQHLTPLLKESKFKETGVLTPEEFVAAGDHMVQQCPTWQWMKSEEGKKKEFFPDDKQFLITKNVPCYKRVRQVEDHTDDKEKVLEEGDGDEGWVDTHYYSEECGLSNTVGEMSLNRKDDSNQASQAATNIPLTGLTKGDNNDGDEEDEDEEAVDMEAYLNSSKPQTGNIVQTSTEQGKATPINEVKDKSDTHSTQNSDILKTRSYDLHITYDTYYRTPRLWLFGYDEDRRPLTVEEVYEDISQDHVKKTVTMETHPHVTRPPMASVHPCRHAEVMKKLIEVVAEGGYDLGVHMYLMVFLKFVQAVIPTIEYDYTQNFNMGRKL